MINQRVSAIVPVFNEAKTVARVIQSLLDSRLLSEIICVNDGSRDETAQVLSGFGGRVKVVTFRQNRGKGAALAEGVRRSTGNLIFFCDADLLNFSVRHITDLLEPVLCGKKRASLGVPTIDNLGRPIKNWRPQAYLAGERVYPREVILPCLAKLSRTRGAGGSEVIFNTLLDRKDVQVVRLTGLRKPSKEQKWSRSLALQQYFFSVWGVLREIGAIEINSAQDFKKLENLLQSNAFEEFRQRLGQVEKGGQLASALRKYFRRYFDYFEKLKSRS